MPGLLVGVGGLGVALVVLPLIALFLRGIREAAWERVGNDAVQSALELSLLTATISVGVILLTGTPLAYGLARYEFRGKGVVSVLVELPIVMPPAVAGLALLLAFGRTGLIGTQLNQWFGVSIPFTTTAVVIAEVFVALPFYVRTAQVGFESIPAQIEEAAMVDGADGMARLRYITLPLARRAMLAGLLLSWARALGEFGATILFAGSLQGRTQTLSLLVYSAFEQDINAAIWTAMILISAAAVTMGLARALMRESAIE